MALCSYLLRFLTHPLRPSQENNKRILHTLELYGQTRNLPPDLRARLKKYFDFQQIKKDSENDDQIINEMPVNILTEFCSSQYTTFINKCVIFKGLSPQFTNTLMTKLRRKVRMEFSINEHEPSPTTNALFARRSTACQMRLSSKSKT